MHPNGLDFHNQRRVVILRDIRKPGGKKLAFAKIASMVRTLKGKRSTEDVVRRVYKRFSAKKGRVSYNYRRCGRKPWKVTKEVGAFLIRRLMQLRRKTACTSATLQAELYREKHVKMSVEGIRVYLRRRGFKWKLRSQKPLYNAEQRAARKAFAARFKDMSQAAISKHITLAMDGVVLTVPPRDETERLNFCMQGETHMWRRDNEAAAPELAGADDYPDQVPKSRAVPLWGAISAEGFHAITYHENRKLKRDEWLREVKAGKLFAAVKKLQPGKHEGPRRLLCDNESFMGGKDCKKEYKKKKIQLLNIPARSPEFNPIESFWGWLRQAMRRRDLEDLRNKRPALGKTAWTIRLRRLLKTQKAQTVAKRKFQNFKKVCKVVYQRKGAHSGL